MSTQVINDGWSIQRTMGRLQKTEYGYDGHIATVNGYVVAFADNDDSSPSLNMRFIWNGREHLRSINGRGAWTQRSIAIAAGKFAEEISSP